ncbi:hypothetical protein ACFQU7_27680 [Pseudoroseomonas wenyumeiae]
MLLTKVGRFSPLEAWGMGLMQRIGPKKAPIALARKITVRGSASNPALHLGGWH